MSLLLLGSKMVSGSSVICGVEGSWIQAFISRKPTEFQQVHRIVADANSNFWNQAQLFAKEWILGACNICPLLGSHSRIPSGEKRTWLAGCSFEQCKLEGAYQEESSVDKLQSKTSFIPRAILSEVLGFMSMRDFESSWDIEVTCTISCAKAI